MTAAGKSPNGAPDPTTDPGGYVVAKSTEVEEAARHIAAESPKLAAFTLAQVALWRGIAGRHLKYGAGDSPSWCTRCSVGVVPPDWPCPDLLAVVDACRAYAGDTP